eukprot:3343060-Pyramimonas_sp.AAC.1
MPSRYRAKSQGSPGASPGFGRHPKGDPGAFGSGFDALSHPLEGSSPGADTPSTRHTEASPGADHSPGPRFVNGS